MQNAQMLFERGILPPEFDHEKDIFFLTKELRQNRDVNKVLLYS